MKYQDGSAGSIQRSPPSFILGGILSWRQALEALGFLSEDIAFTQIRYSSRVFMERIPSSFQKERVVGHRIKRIPCSAVKFLEQIRILLR